MISRALDIRGCRYSGTSYSPVRKIGGKRWSAGLEVG